MSPETGRFRLFGIRLRIAAPSWDVWDAVMGRLPPVETLVNGPCERGYAAEPWNGSQTALLVRRGRREPVVAHSAEAAADLIVSDAERFVAGRADDLAFVHAGAVAWAGRAIVLPGRSGSGKSELVAALLREGAELLSDEFAVIDRRGCVHPYARPVALRRAGTERWRAETFGSRAASAPIPIGAIALLRYRPEARFRLIPLSPGATLLGLLRHSLAARRRFELTREILLPVAAAAPGRRGTRGASDVAARALLLLASAQSGHG